MTSRVSADAFDRLAFLSSHLRFHEDRSANRRPLPYRSNVLDVFRGPLFVFIRFYVQVERVLLAIRRLCDRWCSATLFSLGELSKSSVVDAWQSGFMIGRCLWRASDACVGSLVA